jgi:hypothetical protein
VALPANNGDLYVVMVNCPSIAPGWVMQNGETSALKGDRIVYDGDNANWILLATEALGGTMTGITATLPLEEDGDQVNPVISILEARTNTAATVAGDGKGTDGAVHRLAEDTDVDGSAGSGDPRAVVTADLLKATNARVDNLVLAPGGVTTVTTDNVNSNDALSISPTAGDVKIEIATASDSDYGVVQIANASDIINGNSGAGAIIDASQLKDAIDNLPSEAIVSITEDGTSIVSGALEIVTTAKVAPDNIHEKDTKIGVKSGIFCPYDFSSLQDISAAPNP